MRRGARAARVCRAVGVSVEADEAPRALDALHDLVAGVDAKSAADALELQTVSDIDPGRAHGDAGAAVDAIAAPLPALALVMLASGLSAPAAISHRQGLVVDHGGLEARPRAHVGADLLAGPARQQIGR